MEKQEIINRIHTIYPNADITANGENCSFELLVVTDDFQSLGTLQRQQSILKLFSDELSSGKLHAFGIKAKTNEELKQMPNTFIQINQLCHQLFSNHLFFV